MESDDTVLQQAFDQTALASGTDETVLDDESRRTEIERSLAIESENALVHEERKRTQRIAPFMAGLGLFAAASLPFFGGTLWAKRLLQASLTLGILSMLWLWWLAQSNRTIAGRRAELAWTAGFFCTCANTIYFGVYSPAPAIMIMAVVIFSMGSSHSLAIKLYAIAATTELGIAALDATGVMADPGILTANHLPMVERVAGQVLVQSLLIAGYFVGRSARHATTAAITKMQDALRDVERRDVIAREARDKVRRALNIGGAGRHSASTFGSFKLAELIGHGGMGEVYRATHTRSNALAAVKVIHAHLAQDDDFIKRFLREAKLSAAANSPHIVSILDTGEAEGGPYIAMELLSGIDLSGYLSSASAQGTLSLEHLLCLAHQVGEGLDAAAKAGIVHRDIKPQNIFLVGGIETVPMHCKILDFGVARAMTQGATLTRGSSLLGTPAYMAPEQAKGEAVDHRADLHALAAVLYRAGTGLPPFAGETAMAVLLSVVNDMPVRASDAGMPSQFDNFFTKAFAKDPAQRFQSGADLSTAFALACSPAQAEAI